MNQLPPLSNIINQNYNIVFQGNRFKDLDSVEEIIVGIEHTKHDEVTGKTLELLEDDDLFLAEAQSFMSRRTIQIHCGNSVIPMEVFGWDYNECGNQLRTSSPEYWTFYEKDALLKHSVNQRLKLFAKTSNPDLKPMILSQLRSLDDQMASMSSNPRKKEFLQKAHENWGRRQESLMAALEISGNLRKLGARSMHYFDGSLFINPQVVFKRTILQAGLSHVMKTPAHPDFDSSIDRLHDFLKNRNVVILQPKKME